MHDPKFEKEVQQKMEGLEFIPTGSVWANVEQALAPRRRRRAVPVFWWWMLAPGLLLLGAGGALYWRSATPPTQATISTGAAAATPSPVAPVTAANPSPGTPAVVGHPANIPAPGAYPASVPGVHSASIPAASAGSSVDHGRVANKETAISKEAANYNGTATDKWAATDEGSATGNAPGESPVTSPTAAVPGKARQPFGYRPGLIPSLMASSGIRGPRLSSGTPSLAVTGLPSRKRPWAAGFAGGIGLSSFNEPLQRPVAAAAAPAYYANNFTNVTSVNNAGAVKRYTSDIQPGISFWAGVVAQKPLSSRWSLTLGLNLHYYSSRLHTGDVVNTYAPVYASLIASPTVAPVQSYPYYSTGDQQVFTNQYYYLEIPAAVEWQFNHSKTLPLFWRGGVALSRLMGSDALYYDNHTGVYFKDGAVINHTQVSFSTALMAGMAIRGTRIQAGPEVQYGVTGLLQSQAGDGHLLYGGIRMVILPGK